MFGKVASISIILTVSAFAGESRASDLTPGTGGLTPLSPVQQRDDLDIPQVATAPQNGNALPHTTDTPTAPLPPALWPGLLLLVTLGGAKVLVSARRRIARG